MNSKELRQERAGLVEKARGLVNRVEGENRDMNTEENSEYQNVMDAVNSLEKRIARIEELEGTEDDLEQSASRDDGDAVDSDEASRDGDDDDKDCPDGKRSSKRSRRGYDRSQPRLGMWEEKTATNRYATKGYSRSYWCNMFPELRSGKYARPEYRDIVLGAAGSDAGGGYFATPTKLSDQFVHNLDNLSFVRESAYIETLDEAKSLGVRQMTVQPAASWSGEITQVVPDTSTTLARRDLYPNLVSCLVTISLRELQAAKDVESIMLDRMTYQIGVKTETAYVAGSGSGQPLGLFTASSSGIPTSQDISSSVALAKIFTADDVYSLLYNLPEQYRRSPKFRIFGHRSVAQYIRTLKDGVGQYIWAAGLQPGQPDVLAGYKFCVSEYAPTLNPSSPTASQYVLCAGDMNFYHIADVAGETSPQIVRLTERFADLNEIGLMIRFWTDASPVLGPAFSRLQLKAS